ncbi:MAG TPA: class I SAM-dependent methyltransferase [Ktedonobacteraceae bacterium]
MKRSTGAFRPGILRKQTVSDPVMCEQAATSRTKPRKEYQAMPIPPEPKREHPSTYVVQDRSNQEELNRLQIQDHLFTANMGGVLPEQPDPTVFSRVLDVGCGTGGWLIELAQTTPTCKVLIGVDASLTFVEYARAQAEATHVSDRVEFHVADALRMLEFPTHFFDLVNHRAGMGWLRTWDWHKLLEEYQRVCRPGGVVRITEPEWAVSNSPALSRLSELIVQAFSQAGYIFTPTRDGLTSKLAHLLQQYGLQQVQTRISTLQYHAGTPEWQGFFENTKLAFRTVLPFLHKWTRVPDNYEEIYQQMLREMQQPDFAATLDLLTAWGHPKDQSESDFRGFERAS